MFVRTDPSFITHITEMKERDYVSKARERDYDVYEELL